MTFIEEYIKKSDIFDLIPSNTGITDETLSNLIISYNYEVMEYLRLTRSTNENNPHISQLKEKILLSRSNILQTITNMKEGTMLRRNDIIRKNESVDSLINNVPTIEREYIAVTREQEVKRNLYLFLLQKREENQLTMSTNQHVGKIINHAYTPGISIAPRKSTVAEVLKMNNNSYVSIQGNIVKRLSDDKYSFKDNSGTITVEIDEDKWGGVTAGTQDKLELIGEVEKKYNTTELDVDSVRKL